MMTLVVTLPTLEQQRCNVFDRIRAARRAVRTAGLLWRRDPLRGWRAHKRAAALAYAAEKRGDVLITRAIKSCAVLVN